MPAPAPELTLADARTLVRERSFPSCPRPLVGAEVEFLTVPLDGGLERPDVPTLRRILAPVEPLPCGSRLTFEPGGQVEISTAPVASLGDACTSGARDIAVVRRALAAEGLGLLGCGLDPVRPERRVTDEPRYAAMDAYLSRGGPDGRTMMTNTASIQVNVCIGDGKEAAARWRLAHLVGPTLVAAFANSPIGDGEVNGWRSGRMAAWYGIDPSRTAPVAGDGEPTEAWTRYALDALVMLIRSEGAYVPLAEPLPFRRWVEAGHPLGYPTLDDLDYHLTTLFPPVRPRGWLELRMIDALPDPWWRVPVAVVTAILDDPEAACAAKEASSPAAGLWRVAAREGLDHPALRSAAKRCLCAAIEALSRVGVDPETATLVEAFAERYTLRGRTPADERLEAWGATLTPVLETQEVP